MNHFLHESYVHARKSVAACGVADHDLAEDIRLKCIEDGRPVTEGMLELLREKQPLMRSCDRIVSDIESVDCPSCLIVVHKRDTLVELLKKHMVLMPEVTT